MDVSSSANLLLQLTLLGLKNLLIRLPLGQISSRIEK